MSMNRTWLLAALVALPPLHAAEPQRPPGDPELGLAIAIQGDAALERIRRESTRLAPPRLPPQLPQAARRDEPAPTLEEISTRARIVSLRRDVYVARPEAPR